MEESVSTSQRVEKVEALYRRNHRGYWVFKRTFDIVASILALIVLSPLFLILSIVIWLDDPHGNPFYSQVRVGRHGKEFKMYKFRSMVVNADAQLTRLMGKNEKDGPVFKIKNDPRITRIGRFIRKTSIDEFPQLFNILKGDMTIVGPRPPLPSEVKQYDAFQRLRLIVTPGLTCDWQVQPMRDDISFEEWMNMDIDYIGERTVWKDIKLIFKTIKVMFKGGGS